MGLFDIFSKKPVRPQNVLQYEDIWGVPYTGGYVVNQTTAMGLSAVWACINLLSSSIASLPITVYQIDEDGKKQPYKDSNLYTLLKFAPNSFQTPNDFVSIQMYAILIYGESFARIYRNSRGEITSLIPLNNAGVTVQFNKAGTDLEYVVYYLDPQGNKTSDILSSSQVLHVRGLFSDILKPLSPISVQRETLAIAGTLKSHELAFFGENAARPGGVIEASGKVAPSTIKRILSIFNKSSAGVKNAGKTLFLEEGLKFTPFALSNIDAQFIESMKFSIPEVCRIFNVPPSLIADNEKSTFSNAEQQSLSFVTYSLRPYIEKFESAMIKALVPKSQWQTTEIDFDTTALLRGDATTQSNYVGKLIQNCVMTPNEGREFLGLSKVADPKANELFIQQNMAALESLDQQAAAGASAVPSVSPEEDTTADAVALTNAIFLAKNIVDIESNFDKLIDKKIGVSK